VEFLRQYEILFRKARTDLKAARNLLEDLENGDDELDLESVMFHLQQSAEKVLKSYLAFKKLHFTKTHDIQQLLVAAKEIGIALPENTECLIELNSYAVEDRYAVVHDDLSDADKYIKVLIELLVLVKEEENIK
jgi:HEPN domain-containing protein